MTNITLTMKKSNPIVVTFFHKNCYHNTYRRANQMKWEKIQLDIPYKILDIYRHIQRLAPNSCIAGGCLSDLYMNRPFKDVDIFIKANEIKQKTIEDWFSKEGAIKLKESKMDAAYKYKTALDVQTYQYQDYEIQLVFTPFGVTAPKYFDYRFREFFYFKNQSYASPEALLDIQEKKLVFGVTKAPLVALFRALKFKEKYGFEIDEFSFLRFKQLFSTYQIPNAVWDEYLQKEQYTADKQHRFQQWLPQKTASKPYISYTSEPLSKEWSYHLKNRHFKRDQIEEIAGTAENTQYHLLHMDINPYIEKLNEQKKIALQMFKKVRLQLAIQYPKTADQWAQSLQNIEFTDYTILYEMLHYINKGSEYLYPLRAACIQYGELKRKSERVFPYVILTLDYKNMWKGNIYYNARDTSLRRYVKIKLEHFGEFVWDIWRKKVVFCQMDEIMCEAIIKRLEEDKVFD